MAHRRHKPTKKERKQTPRGEDAVHVKISPDNGGIMDFMAPPDIAAVQATLPEEERGRVIYAAILAARTANALWDVHYQPSDPFVETVHGRSFKKGDNVLERASFPARFLRDELDKAESSHPKTLEHYLTVLEHLRKNASEPSQDTTPEIMERAAIVWAETRRARLIEIRRDLYQTLYDENNKHVDRLIKAGVEASGQDASKVAESIIKAGEQLPFPEKLPFESVFFSLRNPVMLDGEHIEMRLRGDISTASFKKFVLGSAGMVLGYLVTETPMAFEFFTISPRGRGPFLISLPLYLSDRKSPTTFHRWLSVPTMAPWLLSALVEIVNDHKALVLEAPDEAFKRQWRKQRRLFDVHRRVPPPYYSVLLRDKLVDESLERSRNRSGVARFHYGHRFDVRRHERVRIARGPLPLSDKLRKKLERPGRRIYTTEPLPTDDAVRLARRGVQPKRVDEWMAILVTEIEPHQKPKDQSLPYIPATRKLPKRRKSHVDNQSG